MPDIVTWMREYQSLLEWLGGLSLLMFVVTLVVFPLVVIFLPEDYFVRHERDPAYQKRQHPAVWLSLTVLKNILGGVLILAGLAMLLLPGQGRGGAEKGANGGALLSWPALHISLNQNYLVV